MGRELQFDRIHHCRHFCDIRLDRELRGTKSVELTNLSLSELALYSTKLFSAIQLY